MKLPREIDQAEQIIAAFDKDIEVLREYPLPEEDFVGMNVDGKLITDKEEAGNQILGACKKSTHGEVVPISCSYFLFLFPVPISCSYW